MKIINIGKYKLEIHKNGFMFLRNEYEEGFEIINDDFEKYIDEYFKKNF